VDFDKSLGYLSVFALFDIISDLDLICSNGALHWKVFTRINAVKVYIAYFKKDEESRHITNKTKATNTAHAANNFWI